MVVALSLRNISSYDRPHIRFDLAMTGSHARRCMDCIVAKPGSKDVFVRPGMDRDAQPLQSIGGLQG